MTQAVYNPASPSVDADAAHTVACTHCGLPVPKGLIRPQHDNQFCCRACESAYEVIHGCGLDTYYRLRQQSGADNQRLPSNDAKGREVFDSTKYHDLYVRSLEDGACATDLLLEGVHCAACIWLIERLPRVVPGVVEARLSLRDATCRIVWDPAQVKLSAIAQALGTLGYTAHPARCGDKHGIHLAEQRAMLVRLGVAGALAGNTMLLAFALYTGMFSGMQQQYSEFFRWLSAGLGVLSLAWPGRVFFRGAWAAIRTRTPHLDVPIALALGVGGLAGAINVVMGRGEIYFDSLTVLIFLLLIGRFIQYRQQRRADESLGLLLSLVPSNCYRVTGPESNETIEQVPIEAVEIDDLIEVRSGELIPADGVVEQGRASVIAALITGESNPLAVAKGSAVAAGSRLVGATLRVRVSAVGEASRIGRLMALVEQGMSEKPGIVALTDRVAGWFVWVVSLIALAVCAGWVMIDPGKAIDHTVALLIIACPCALGLATPLTLAVAMGRAARRDILIKSGAALDQLATPGRLLLDKTGTITRGEMRVEAWFGETKLQPIIAEIERHAVHPVAGAIVDAYGSLECSAEDRLSIGEVRVHGSGVSAQNVSGSIHVGSQAFIQEVGVTIPPRYRAQAERWHDQALTPVYIAQGDSVQAVLAVGDALHKDSAASINTLRSWGWEVEMLTGDVDGVATQVGQAVGLAPEVIRAGVSPEQKLQAARLRGGGGAVVMVGDGINDTAALAAADVGIAVSGGAEPSMKAADVYLARPGLSGLVDLIETARNSRRVIRRNLVVSLTYNAVAIGLAAAGYINPLVAAVLMPVSSALVLGLAMQGQRVTPRHGVPRQEVKP